MSLEKINFTHFFSPDWVSLCFCLFIPARPLCHPCVMSASSLFRNSLVPAVTHSPSVTKNQSECVWVCQRGSVFACLLVAERWSCSPSQKLGVTGWIEGEWVCVYVISEHQQVCFDSIYGIGYSCTRGIRSMRSVDVCASVHYRIVPTWMPVLVACSVCVVKQKSSLVYCTFLAGLFEDILHHA